MNFDDEKDLQQILFLAARILERRHNQTDGSAPSLIASPTNPDNPPLRQNPERRSFIINVPKNSLT